MGKFDKKPGGDSGRRGGRAGERAGKKSKPETEKGYKEKRSFTKNKDFRDKKSNETEKPRRSFGSDERKPFKRDYDKQGGFRDKDADRPKRTFERDERSERKKDSDSPSRSFRDNSRDERKERGTDERKPFKRNNDWKPKGEGFRGGDDKKPFERKYGSKDRFDDKPGRRSDDERPSFRKNEELRGERGGNDRRPFERDGGRSQKSEGFRGRDDKKPFERKTSPRESTDERSGENSDFRPRKANEGDGEDFIGRPKKRSASDDKFEKFRQAVRKSHGEGSRDEESPKKQRLTKPRRHEDAEGTKRVKFDEFEDGKVFSNKKERTSEKKETKKSPVKKQTAEGLIRLNKYLSNAGIASRREADNLIQSGVVKVNGVVIDQLGYKINPGDKVTYGDANVKSERKVYLLLNKPKDYITTVDDPRERKTVMELIKGACRERVYPVGRLDRNTTGLLLFTNDGELTTKLTHPKFGVKKVYQVSLNKGLRPVDFTSIVEGVELEDGIVKADDLAFVGEGKKEIGIEIHSGRNRIVRRLFEHLGYDVLKLDRVVFAGLTKKDLPRGKHRFLTAKEISFLQMIG